MSQGYSSTFIKKNQAADQSLAAVRLGALCIERGIPVVVVAEALNVSRQTVYNWFCGSSIPHPLTRAAVHAFYDQHH